MPNHAAVNPVDHKMLRIREERSEAAGDGAMCAITFPGEFRNVQAHYPILFRMDPDRSRFTCMALFGFENGENLFLKNQAWDARYVPLSMDVMPFMIGLPQNASDERKVVLDMDSPRIHTGEGQRIFDDSGLATPYLEGISQKLDALDKGFKTSRGFTEALKVHDLLEPLTLDITLVDQSENRLLGFHIIHEEKLSDLDAGTLKDLQKQGYLQAIYMALASLSNLADLVDRKNARVTHAR
ncbi:MAG: SapC family protein [Pseudomonadota bacterium]